MAEDYAERSWTTPDGIALYARDYYAAQGPARLPVICLHGLTRNSQDFEEIAAAIAASGRRVVVPDVRGRGRSGYDPDPMNYHPRTYARDMLGLLDACGIARAVFIGTSMGGIITMAVALMRSRTVAAAVLNDIGPEAAAEGLARIAAYAGISVTADTWEEAKAYVRGNNAAAFPHADDAAWEVFARRTFRDHDGRPVLDYDPDIRVPIAAGKLRAPRFIAWRMFRRLARRRPTLLLRGELSDLLSRDIVRQMQGAAPAMRVLEVPGVGHAPLLSEPEAEAAILSFLAEAP